MPRHRLNALIRTFLAVTVLLTVALTILSARPGYRFFGAFPAQLVTPQSINGIWDTPALYVTLTHPAVVTMPPEWGMADQICVVLQITRGPAPTQIEFFDQMPQIRWDDKPGETVIFGPDDVLGRDPDGGRLIVSNALLAAPFSLRVPFRVNWVGQVQTPVYEDAPLAGLMCYHFALGLGANAVMSVPFSHQLSFKAKNVNVMRRPAYNFIYNVPDPERYGPDAVILKKQDVMSYLAQLAIEAPFAVVPQTAAQTSQRATEFAQIENR